MPWLYIELPEALRLPPCPKCRNRGRVHQFARWSYYCGDCDHAFAAEWEEAPKTVKQKPPEEINRLKGAG